MKSQNSPYQNNIAFILFNRSVNIISVLPDLNKPLVVDQPNHKTCSRKHFEGIYVNA